MPKLKTTDEFIADAIKRHGNKYDYSKVKYTGKDNKVCIICPIHGEFWQNANNHKNGSKCPKCQHHYIPTNNEFIEQVQLVHHNRYDYSRVEYKKSYSKICIICPEHGEFWQSPIIHLNGGGCPVCAGTKRLTTEEFISRANKIHGDKYDYSLVDYKNSQTKIEIICSSHGIFLQKPGLHLKGYGCPICSGVKRISQEEFIFSAIERHNGKYDYSQVEYKNKHSKVRIICPYHGLFLQTPGAHLKGSGCPACAGVKKLTTSEFIEKSIQVHGNKYDYSKVNYIDSGTKVIIGCKIHGEFLQQPTCHIQGQGCPACGGTKKLTNREFLVKAKEIHGDKYDYSKVKYISCDKKVTIICPIHGEFLQTPDSHIYQKSGCIKCGAERRGLLSRKNTEKFIEDAKRIHGSKYDYSKTKYISSNYHVCIICPKHGEFWQDPNNHINGANCPKCSSEKIREMSSFSTEEFILNAKAIHGDKYDYSLVEYNGANKPVCIICPEHGEFWQVANNHVRGADCIKCAYKNNAEKLSKTFDDFIERAKEVHGEKYDYSLAADVYRRRLDRIPIICPNHGVFYQVAMQHLCGSGCPICTESQLERKVRLFLERHNINYENEKTFKWLKHNGSLWLDFYLPDYKVAIECQGLQHFEPVEIFGGENGFREWVELDKQKLKLCDSHGIKMLYFSQLDIEYPYPVIEDLNTLLKSIKSSTSYRAINPCRQLKLQFKD